MTARAGRLRRLSCFPLLFLLLAAGFAVALKAGVLSLSAGEILAALRGEEVAAPSAAVVLRVRLPRALLAALVGASLGASGSAFQAVLRNPLADPYILGISGGAGLGAVAAIAAGWGEPGALPLAAFLGGLAALGVVYAIAGTRGGSSPALILSGVMVGSLASALLLFLLWTLPGDRARAALFWLAGDLSGGGTWRLVPAAAWSAAAFLVLWLRARTLDLFTQGEAAAADLGLDVGRARVWLLAAAGALAASTVALAGLVGFVGLVVPHAVRLLWGPTHRRLLPASALLGGTFLLFADALARTALAPSELPVGVVTALLGAPAFLLLLRRQRRAA